MTLYLGRDRQPFEILGPDGARDDRILSKVVNLSMTGKLNAVVDFSVDQTELQLGPVALEDPRISSQSYISFMPLNIAATFAVASIITLPPTKGSVSISPPNQALTGMTATVGEAGTGQDISDVPAEELSISQITGTPLYNATVNPTSVTTAAFGNHSVTFSGGGLISANTGVEVGFHIVDAALAIDLYYVIETSRGNNTRINWSVSTNYLLSPNATIAPVMNFVDVTGNLDNYNYIMTVEQDGSFGVLPIDVDPNDDLGLGLNDPLEFRTLIIG